MACSSTRRLTSGGLSPEERRFYIIQNGWGMSTAMKKCFIAGKPMIGMNKEHIFMLFGHADQIVKDETKEIIIWKYFTIENRELVIALEAIFDSDETEVLQISSSELEKCEDL